MHHLTCHFKGSRRSDGSDSGNSDASSDSGGSSCGSEGEGRMDPGVRKEVLEFVNNPEIKGFTTIYKNN